MKMIIDFLRGIGSFLLGLGLGASIDGAYGLLIAIGLIFFFYSLSLEIIELKEYFLEIIFKLNSQKDVKKYLKGGKKKK